VGAAGAAAVPLTSRRNLDARRLDVDMRRELDARHAPAAGATGATGAAGAAGATGAAAAARAAGAARGAHGAPAARPDHPARPARPHPAAVWRAFRVDDRRGTIVRPPGVGIDLGGSGKGHAADRVAALLRSASAWVVDAGGDVRIGGVREVLVGHPLQPAPAARLRIADGAAATSSIVRRSWRTADGRVGHHLIDPATGRPAWTGLLSVTALAPTTLEAETLAKAALLSGPDGARRLLARFGGVVIGASGDVERVGPLPEWSDRPDGGTARPGPGPAEIGPDRPDGATARAVREPTEIEMEAAA